MNKKSLGTTVDITLLIQNSVLISWHCHGKWCTLIKCFTIFLEAPKRFTVTVLVTHSHTDGSSAAERRRQPTTIRSHLRFWCLDTSMGRAETTPMIFWPEVSRSTPAFSNLYKENRKLLRLELRVPVEAQWIWWTYVYLQQILTDPLGDTQFNKGTSAVTKHVPALRGRQKENDDSFSCFYFPRWCLFTVWTSKAPVLSEFDVSEVSPLISVMLPLMGSCRLPLVARICPAARPEFQAWPSSGSTSALEDADGRWQGPAVYTSCGWEQNSEFVL